MDVARRSQVGDAARLAERAGLAYIDFVKIQTGVLAQSGDLGETSTEVFSVRDLNFNAE